MWERGWSSIKSRFAKSTGNEGRVSIAERSTVWWTERREPGQSASVVQDLFRSLVVSVSVATAGNYACRSLWLALRLNQVLCHTVLDRVVVEAVSRRNWLRVEVAGHLHIRGEVSAFQLISLEVQHLHHPLPRQRSWIWARQEACTPWGLQRKPPGANIWPPSGPEPGLKLADVMGISRLGAHSAGLITPAPLPYCCQLLLT